MVYLCLSMAMMYLCDMHRHARVVYAAHPIPDEGSSLGAQMIMDMADTMTEKDLVFAGITGGSSALLAAPVDGVSFEDIQKVHELLILSGADIFKINAVRKHLSSIKGGWRRYCRRH